MATVSPSTPQTNGVSPHDPPSYSAQESQPEPVIEYAIIVYRPGAGYRFLSAFFVATIIWVLFGMLVRSSLYVLHPGKWQRDSEVLLPVPIGDHYSIPPGLSLDQCIQGRDWKFSNASTYQGFGDDGWVWGATSYDLPVSSDTLLVVSRGQNLVGTVEIETSPHQSRNHATLRVLMSSSSDTFLEGTKACVIKRKENELGVGVFTPTSWIPADPPGTKGSHYRIVVVFPKSQDPSTLLIKNFETDVPGSAHIVQDLGAKVLFDKISLNGSNGFVSAKSLRANVLNINTTGNTISGNFQATRKVSLSTTYANILANVNLTNREGQNSTLNINTNGGYIRAKVNLSSTALSPGSFYVNANNSGGGVHLVFHDLLPQSLNSSELHVKATVSRGLAVVTIPPTYEGTFDLRTDYKEPVVQINPDIGDPFGLGRRRRLSYESVETGAVTGYVDWGAHGKGTISLISSSSHYLTGVQLYG